MSIDPGFAFYSINGCLQVQSLCRQACEHTRHCKRVRHCDDKNVLVLLGPVHLVPDGFWEAANSILEAEGSFGEGCSRCVRVPAVTTVPITQVKAFFLISISAFDSLMAISCPNNRSSSSNGERPGPYRTGNQARSFHLRRSHETKLQ